MKTIHAFRILLVVVMVSLPLVAVTPAYADKPDQSRHWTEPVDDTYYWYACGFENPIVDHVYGTLKGEYFFNEAGDVVKGNVSYGSMRETWSVNDKHVDLQIQGPIHYRTIVLGAEFYQIYLGVSGIITIPGYGRVYGWSGQWVLRWEFNPSIDDWEITGVVREVGSTHLENWDAICAYLAP
jgi:hypothetical protein